MMWHFPDRPIKVKSQKTIKIICTFQFPAWRCRLLDCSHIRREFARTAFAVMSCAISGLSELYSPVAHIWPTRVCDIPGVHLQVSKLVIDKTIVQSRSLFLQLWAALFQSWLNFTPLLFISGKPGCVLFEAHTFWLRLLVLKKTFVLIVLQM